MPNNLKLSKLRSSDHEHGTKLPNYVFVYTLYFVLTPEICVSRVEQMLILRTKSRRQLTQLPNAVRFHLFFFFFLQSTKMLLLAAKPAEDVIFFPQF